MEEIWKEIIGYEGYYEISNKGNVRSIDRYVLNNGSYVFIKGKNKSFINNGIGYLTVKLCMNGVEKRFYIHRLVALHFIKNNKNHNHNDINHLDGCKNNNWDINLEWVTKKSNYKHAVENSLIKRDVDGRFL